jgi:hypothetical protein
LEKARHAEKAGALALLVVNTDNTLFRPGHHVYSEREREREKDRERERARARARERARARGARTHTHTLIH